MTTKQSNRLTMAKTLKHFFSVEQETYSGNSPLILRVSELDAIISNLDALAGVQTTDTTANTGLKTNAVTLMINLTVAYANSAADYFDGKDSPLAKQLTTSKTKIKNMSGVEAKIYCQQLYDRVSENTENLDPDYVTASEAQEWLTAIGNFDAKAYDAGVKIDKTQNATKDLENEFIKLRVCLSKIDRLMKKYDILNRSFHGNYKLSRKTSDLGSRHSNEAQEKQ